MLKRKLPYCTYKFVINARAIFVNLFPSENMALFCLALETDPSSLLQHSHDTLP